MALEIKHQFQSAKGDGPDTTLVQPSDWNALHVINMAEGLLGNPGGGGGVGVEVPIGPGLEFVGGILQTTMREIPVAVVLPLAGNYEPPGWLICDGRAVSRVTYSVLFGIIQTKFGAGDGSTTFNIPDMRGRVPAGKDNLGGTSANRLTPATISGGATDVGKVGGTERHVLTINQLAAHGHTATLGNHFHYIASDLEGASSSPQVLTLDYAMSRKNNPSNNFAYTLMGVDDVPTTGWTSNQIYESGVTPITIANSGVNEPHLNLQPTITMNYVIFTGVYP